MKKLALMLSAFLSLFLVAAGAANAEPAQPGVAEVEGGFTSVETLLTGTLIPAVIGLVVIGLVVAVGLKYLRRGANKA